MATAKGKAAAFFGAEDVAEAEARTETVTMESRSESSVGVGAGVMMGNAWGGMLSGVPGASILVQAVATAMVIGRLRKSPLVGRDSS